MTPKSVIAWIEAEMEFALSQAVASGDMFEHRPSECGHCVQNFLADLDLRDLPGEAAGSESGADDTLPTADLRFYPAALVVPCGHLPGHAAVAADLGNMAIPNGWIPRRLRSGHCVLCRRYNHIQGFEVLGIFKETASGTRNNRLARNRVLQLAQARRIDAVLVTELSRWGRSTQDLLDTLYKLAGWKVSLVAMNGMTFELNTPHGRMMATMLAGIAQFERDLLSECVKSGLASARARGKKLGRQPGQRPKSDRLAPKVLHAIDGGKSYRWIARDLGISKNTVAEPPGTRLLDTRDVKKA